MASLRQSWWIPQKNRNKTKAGRCDEYITSWSSTQASRKKKLPKTCRNIHLNCTKDGYRISSHISRTSKVRKWAWNKGCDLYEGHNYNGSQWRAIPGYSGKIMGATCMRVRPICEDTWYFGGCREEYGVRLFTQAPRMDMSNQHLSLLSWTGLSYQTWLIH